MAEVAHDHLSAKVIRADGRVKRPARLAALSNFLHAKPQQYPLQQEGGETLQHGLLHSMATESVADQIVFENLGPRLCVQGLKTGAAR